MTQVVTGITKAKPGKYTFQRDPRHVRLQDPETGQYLHMSGQGRTDGTLWAWLGFGYQAQALAERAKAAGEDWPFVVVRVEE